MNHALTIKLPDSLFQKLTDFSHRQGVSKGSLIRGALESALDAAANDRDELRRLTKELHRKKPSRSRVDWNAIYKQTRRATTVSPEEEVLISRGRGL